jgi:hypothetical protein
MVINPLCMAPKIAAESSPFVAQRDVCLGGIDVTSDGICYERQQSDFYLHHRAKIWGSEDDAF